MQVAGTEVVAPLQHAVRLVDGHQVDARGLREEQEIVGPQPFRRDVQDTQSPAMSHVVDALALLRRDTAVDERGRHSPGLQGLHLVAHERAQGRDDDGERPVAQGGQLVADALAAAGRHHGDQVVPVEDRVDGLELAGTERLVAVRLVEPRKGRLGIVLQLAPT